MLRAHLLIWIAVVLAIFVQEKNRYSIKGLIALLRHPGNILPYRLGDVYYWRPSFLVVYHSILYPNSIAAKYVHTTYRPKNFEKLLKIVDSRKYVGQLMEPTELLLHLRVGDVLCMYDDNRVSRYSKPNLNGPWWNELFEFIKLHKIKTVCVIYGNHTDLCKTQTTVYIQRVVDTLRKFGLHVRKTSSLDADNDVLMAKHAPYIASTGGGFGKLMKRITHSYNGIVFESHT
jgi:hypothetical protein